MCSFSDGSESTESDPFADSGSEYLPSDENLEETNRDGTRDETEANIEEAEPVTPKGFKPKKRIRNPEL